MQNPSIAYTTRQLLSMSQGPALLDLLRNPSDIREVIESLEKFTYILRENEQWLYPDQAPKAWQSRQGDAVQQKQIPDDTEQQRLRILRVVAFLTKKTNHPPTARMIRQYCNTTKELDQIILLMVREGKLKELHGGRTNYYAIPGQSEMQALLWAEGEM